MWGQWLFTPSASSTPSSSLQLTRTFVCVLLWLLRWSVRSYKCLSDWLGQVLRRRDFCSDFLTNCQNIFRWYQSKSKIVRVNELSEPVSNFTQSLFPEFDSKFATRNQKELTGIKPHWSSVITTTATTTTTGRATTNNREVTLSCARLDLSRTRLVSWLVWVRSS